MTINADKAVAKGIDDDDDGGDNDASSPSVANNNDEEGGERQRRRLFACLFWPCAQYFRYPLADNSMSLYLFKKFQPVYQ